MDERVSRWRDVRRSFATVVGATLAAVLLYDTSTATAQSVGAPSVIVDEAVLDKLGPPIWLAPAAPAQDQEPSSPEKTAVPARGVTSPPVPPSVKPVVAKPPAAKQEAAAARDPAPQQQTSQLLPPPEQRPQSTLTLPGEPPQTFSDRPAPTPETTGTAVPAPGSAAPSAQQTVRSAPPPMPKVTKPEAPRPDPGAKPEPATVPDLVLPAVPVPSADRQEGDAAATAPATPSSETAAPSANQAAKAGQAPMATEAAPVQEAAGSIEMPRVVPPKPVEPPAAPLTADGPASHPVASAPMRPSPPTEEGLPPAPTVVAPKTQTTAETEAPALQQVVAPKAPTAAQAEAPPATPLPMIIPPRGANVPRETSSAAQIPTIIPPTAPAAPSLPSTEDLPQPPKAAVQETTTTPAAAAVPPAAAGASRSADGPPAPEPAAPSGDQIAALPPVREAVPPEILEDGNLYRIPFAAESSDIPEISESRLDEIARRMKEDENLRLQLLGYATGETESASAARRLSLFRALSVRTYLVKHGIRSTRVDVRALGAKESDGMPDRVDIVFKK